MRRYFQGTLDYACGIYAIINALACTHSLDLASARHMFQETMVSFAADHALWSSFVRNDTDHYWVVKYMLGRWCGLRAPYALWSEQPFSDCLLKDSAEMKLDAVRMFLPEREDPSGPCDFAAARHEAETVWDTLKGWLTPGIRPRRVAVLRFHRFLPGFGYPAVSHWTTAASLSEGILRLHDASAEKDALLAFEQRSLFSSHHQRALLRIVPESLLLLER